MDHDYDLIVIGAGSGGVRAARVAATYGAHVAIVEQDRIGGTCVIRGCVPKKLFVYASRFSEMFDVAESFGWAVDANFDWPTLVANKDKEIARLEAAYVAGLVFGLGRHRARQHIARFHDGLAWLSQIVMFLLLGLLVTPSDLVADLVPGLLVALVLMLVARPLAVAVCLLPFRFTWAEIAFIGWVGLRGAVPIFLATIPVVAGLPNATMHKLDESAAVTDIAQLSRIYERIVRKLLG